jgi:transketolase
VGAAGATVALDHFGASAPGDVLMREFGFTTDHVVRTVEALLLERARAHETNVQ